MATETTGNGNGNDNGNSNHPDLGAEVFNVIAADSITNRQNVLLSPLLLESTLALLYLGADGSTAEELKRVLQLRRFGDSDGKVAQYFAAALETATREADTNIQLNSALMHGANFEAADQFKKVAQNYFYTATQQLDATSVVEKILQRSVDTDIGAILYTQIVFPSKWFLPFSAYRSGVYDFQLSDGTQKPVSMLFDDDMFVKFAELRELDARAIELPYEHADEDLTMLLILPNQRDGLAALESELAGGGVNLSELAERMQMESVQVLLPKFKIEVQCGLRQSLEKLGITLIFSKGANFKNLLRDGFKEPLQILDIVQKVCIEVNESGSSPSSVVANKPIVISNSIDSRQKFFRADHPFYFAIRNGDVNYFVGHVTTF